MLREDRVWCLEAVLSAEELAEKLTERAWPACQAFEFKGYIFANDSADMRGHFVVMKREHATEFLVLLESINFSVWQKSQALAFVQKATMGDFDVLGFFRVSDRQFEAPVEHSQCQYCQKGERK